MSTLDDVANYWKSVSIACAQQHESIIQAQREEIQTLQRRCQELQYENAMMRASNAMDFREFCVASANINGQVPLSQLLSFLNTTSDGLVPAPDNARKRQRDTRPSTVVPPLSPATRAMQRLLFLNRTPVREGDFDGSWNGNNNYNNSAAGVGNNHSSAGPSLLPSQLAALTAATATSVPQPQYQQMSSFAF